MIEAAASSTLFFYESWGSFGNEYFLQILYFTFEKGSFLLPKGQFRWLVDTHLSFQGNHYFPLRWVTLKEIFHANHRFQGGLWFMFFQIVLFSWVEETHVPLKRKSSVLEARACSTFFPVRIDLVWKRILTESSVFPGGDMLCLLQIGLFTWVEKHLYLSNGNHLC
jgi:hypothetical protein